jgi:hypothetical protein
MIQPMKLLRAVQTKDELIRRMFRNLAALSMASTSDTEQ